uniref:Uncharacterized protein n=1 Tax=Marmota marmota marmota TaxID=9994 RepID=A0A8C5ZRC7_MARMA
IHRTKLTWSGDCRSAWRVISSMEQKTDMSDKKLHKVFYLKMKGGYFWYLAEVAYYRQ